jgi:uncharacterized protein YraI
LYYFSGNNDVKTQPPVKNNTINTTPKKPSTISTGVVQTKTGSTLRLRSEPSEESTILASIPYGTTVTILEYDDHFSVVNGENGKWCKINYYGTEGWAWGGFIKRNQ